MVHVLVLFGDWLVPKGTVKEGIGCLVSEGKKRSKKTNVSLSSGPGSDSVCRHSFGHRCCYQRQRGLSRDPRYHLSINESTRKPECIALRPDCSAKQKEGPGHGNLGTGGCPCWTVWEGLLPKRKEEMKGGEDSSKGERGTRRGDGENKCKAASLVCLLFLFSSHLSLSSILAYFLSQ